MYLQLQASINTTANGGSFVWEKFHSGQDNTMKNEAETTYISLRSVSFNSSFNLISFNNYRQKTWVL